MDPLEQAINGITVTLTYTQLKDSFISLADLQAWCSSFGLQYEFIEASNSYKISKQS